MTKVHIMHYLNQFFAGMGGEDKASLPIDFLKGPIGPGKRLQQLLGNSAEIVVTAYCGDNYFAEHTNSNEVLEKILGIARDYDVNMLVAGPAFNAGRYGFACVELCHFLTTSLGIPCVSGMFNENPGVEGYRQYKDKGVFILPTAAETSGMEDALSKMARFVSKLAAGSPIGAAGEEGYIPRGLRVLEAVKEKGAKRGIDMLLDKLAGGPFTTEIPLPRVEETPIAPPIVNLKDAHLALASTGGIHSIGNPYGCKPIRDSRWGKYSIDKLDSMQEGKWIILHQGYNSVFMAANPNYGAPLDVCREMERRGAFAKLSGTFCGTTGVGGAMGDMKKIGQEMVRDMKKEGVDGILLVATWGTCTRSGAVIAKEIEKEGLPVALITAMVSLAKQMGAKRIIQGVSIPHPCGNPALPEKADLALRREIVKCALKALQEKVDGATVFVPGSISG